MRTGLPSLYPFSLALLLAVGACDSEANPGPEGTTTNMTGADTGDPTDGNPTDSDGGGDGCVPPVNDGWPCSADTDCTIAGDCCSCTTYNPEFGWPGNCGGSCGVDKCEQWGITNAACVDGYCAAVGLSCNQTQVTCDAEPPACGPGTLPRVWDGCFTGDCLSIDACDWAPNCAACGDGQLCMQELRGGCDYVRCVDEFGECQGEGPCCVGDSFCSAGTCTPTAEGFACQ